MTFSKLFFIVAAILFGAIFLSVLFKKPKETTLGQVQLETIPIEVVLEPEENEEEDSSLPVITQEITALPKSSIGLPEEDKIELFFNKMEPKFPIVETVVYKSRVPWLKGRPAWLSDYASYYATSRHFIARSLNGKADYLKQNVSEGDRFNVFRKDQNLQFYLVVDLSRCRLWFYYHDQKEPGATLIKTYDVGLGRLDVSKASGILTPLGKYSLGQRVGIYKPGMRGLHQGDQKELITIFGTRWIPFDEELGDNTLAAKGLGIHGLPWLPNEEGILAEDETGLKAYKSDGCIRLRTKDIEEIFSIVITKPTIVELVRDFHEATLPIRER